MGTLSTLAPSLIKYVSHVKKRKKYHVSKKIGGLPTFLSQKGRQSTNFLAQVRLPIRLILMQSSRTIFCMDRNGRLRVFANDITAKLIIHPVSACTYSVQAEG
jgi:hypothetical protein